jgi:hypothetical protein
MVLSLGSKSKKAYYKNFLKKILKKENKRIQNLNIFIFRFETQIL